MSLPNSWCVKNDGSHKFEDVVLGYIGKNDDTWDDYARPIYGYNINCYYGFNGKDYILRDYSFGTELTIDIFERLTSEPEFEYGDEVEVSDNGEMWFSGKFIHYEPREEYPYIIKTTNVGVKLMPVGYRHCRKPKPKWEAIFERGITDIDWYVGNVDRCIKDVNKPLSKEEAQAIAKALNELEEE